MIKNILENIKNFIIENKKLIIILTIAVLVFFGGFLISGNRYMLGNDQTTQYDLFYEEWIHLIKEFIKSGRLPFYSWTDFLGNNFYATKSYYVVGDPFVFFHLISPFSLNYSLLLVEVLLVFVSGLSFSCFIKKFGIAGERSRIIASTAYALSGIACMYFGNYMFYRFYAFLPLLFLGVESYIKEGKWKLFVISVFLEFMQSYYFMFPTSFFLILYYFFSKLYKEKCSPWTVVKSAFPLIGYYLVGLSLSAFVILPTIIQMLSHPRIGDSNITGLVWPLEVMIGFVYNNITPPFNLFTWIPYIFVSGNNGHAYWYSVYTGVFSLIMLGSYIYKGEKRKLVGITYLIMLIFLLCMPLSSMMHGFSEPSFRWSFLYTFFLCLVLAISIDEKVYEKKNIFIPYALFSVLFLVVTMIGIVQGIIDISVHQVHLIGSSTCLIMGWIYILLISKKIDKILLPLFVCELIFSGYLVVHNHSETQQFSIKETFERNYLQYILSSDDSVMYRVYIDNKYFLPATELNLNQGLHNGYMGTSTYDSTYETGLTMFLNWNGIYNHIIKITNPDVLKMLGVKYYVGETMDELPEGNQYEAVYVPNHLTFYKDKNHYEIGFTYSNFVKESDVDEENIKWLDELIVDDEFYKKLIGIFESERVQFNVLQKQNGWLLGDITVEEETVLFLSIPYNEGWKIMDNGVVIPYHKVQGGFIGLYLESGYHMIEMNFVPKGFKSGVLITAVGFATFVVLFAWEKYRAKIDKWKIK